MTLGAAARLAAEPNLGAWMSAGQLAHIESIVFLQSVDLFSFCKAEEVLRIAGIAQEKQVAAGEVIYRANDLADSIYCVVRGEVEVSDSKRGEQVLGPMRTLGVVEILSGRLRNESVTAKTEALLLALSADDFFDLLANNIEIVKALFRYLIRELDQEQEDSA